MEWRAGADVGTVIFDFGNGTPAVGGRDTCHSAVCLHLRWATYWRFGGVRFDLGWAVKVVSLLRIFGRPIRSSLCYEPSVCRLSVTTMHPGKTAGWIEMPLGRGWPTASHECMMAPSKL